MIQSWSFVIRAMGDMVDEMDSHRRKSLALLTRKGPDGRPELDDGEPAPSVRASRSFSKVARFALWQLDVAEQWHTNFSHPMANVWFCLVKSPVLSSVSGEATTVSTTMVAAIVSCGVF